MKIVRRDIPSLSSSYLPQHHPVLRRVFAARQVTDASGLDLSFAQLPTFEQLHGIDSAVNILEKALAERQSVLILTNHDVDGATSCAVLMRGLRWCGAQQINYLASDRECYGYGLSPLTAEHIVQQRPGVLITTDSSISSNEGVDIVRRAGIRVIVTDHRLTSTPMPSADSIINPNQPHDNFLSKSIAGVGVIFYLLSALRAHLRNTGWFVQQGLADPKLSDLLDLVALGTIASEVPLDHTNRIFVDQGLRRIRVGKCCPGISALIQIARRTSNQLFSRDLRELIAPRLSVAGRMANKRLDIECLLCDNFNQALAIATELEELNVELQAKEKAMSSSIEEWLHRLDCTNTASRQASVCIYREDWHPDIIWLLASRIKDRIRRPVIAFARDSDGYLKGFGYSVSSINIRDAIEAVNRQYPGMINRFGGYAMVVEMKLKSDMLERFAAAFDSIVDAQLSTADREGYILSDGALPASYRNLEIAYHTQRAAPWGKGFEEPLFDNFFNVITRRIVGKNNLKMGLIDTPGVPPVPAIAFNSAHRKDLNSSDRLHIAYRLQVNYYRGENVFELCIEHAEPIA